MITSRDVYFDTLLRQGGTQEQAAKAAGEFSRSGQVPSYQAPSTVFSGVGDAFGNLLGVFSKGLQLNSQYKTQNLRYELAKKQIAGASFGPTPAPSYGGINILTLALFGGVGLLAVVLLKRK